MERYTALGVLLFALLAIAVALMFPPEQTPPAADLLPWQIETTESGSIRVFRITLGETTLASAVTKLQEEVEVSMFASADEQKKSVEAYFESTALGGLRAKVVATLQFTPEQLSQIYARGVRVATLGSGSRKVTLSSEDMRWAYQTPVATLTYLPRNNLPQELIEARFGKPAERIVDGESEHWIYPDKGLDIIYSEESKEALQYLRPDAIPALIVHLKQAKAEADNLK